MRIGDWDDGTIVSRLGVNMSIVDHVRLVQSPIRTLGLHSPHIIKPWSLVSVLNSRPTQSTYLSTPYLSLVSMIVCVWQCVWHDNLGNPIISHMSAHSLRNSWIKSIHMYFGSKKMKIRELEKKKKIRSALP